MGKKMTRAGMLARRAIRADVDAESNIDHKILRSKHHVGENIIESALTKTVAEWDALVAITPEDVPLQPRDATSHSVPPPDEDEAVTATNSSMTMPHHTAVMPGLEQGVVKFARKPAKMGVDYIFWVPRVYIKNGLVDPSIEYEVYLKKKI